MLDKNAASLKAEASLKACGLLPKSVELRQVKYLNNLIEQDHRFLKRLTKPGMGFFSFETAWRTLQGFEVMNMIRKGQMQGIGKGDIPSQVAFIARLFVEAVSTQHELLPPSACFFSSQVFATQPVQEEMGFSRSPV